MSQKMLQLNLSCPHCQEVLTKDARLTLDAHVKETHEDGKITLSAIFGEYRIETDLHLKSGNLVDFRCPKCDASLMLAISCKLCRAPMVSLNIVEQGYVEFCSRHGCKGHAIGGMGDVDQMMQLMNKMFETPYD